MRIGLTLTALLLLLALLTGLLLRGMKLDADRSDSALVALDRFAAGETALQRDVLRARVGMLRNYDPLVKDTNSLDAALDELMQVASLYPETSPAIERLSSSLGRQEELVEQFKSDNALLQNSLAYFELFSNQVMTSGQDESAVRATGALTSAMLNLLLDTSQAATRDVSDRLDRLSAQPSSTGDADTVTALLAHGRLLHDVLPGIDGTLKMLLQVPNENELGAVRNTVLAIRTAARDSARHYWLILYGTSLLLLGLLIHLGLQLRRRAVRFRQQAAFEHLIAAISTRFINATPIDINAPVEEALTDLARHIGADRAYYVETGAEGVRTWRHGSGPWPADWPRRALDLAAHFKSNPTGTIHVRRVDRLSSGIGRETLGSAGVSGWVCVPPAGEDTVRSVLGFDTVGVCVAASGEQLGMLPIARNTIRDAIRRNSLLQARRRLEKRLDQARRMETVGALASGVAHNFNNIIGAIVGHAELAEARLSSDNDPAARNLDAIRRASERARDLVDRILVFGRHREGRRRAVDVSALIAEAGALLRASLPKAVDLVMPPREPVVVSGEPAELQQVIINLCNNAAQAMNYSGAVELAMDVHDVVSARLLSHGELARGRHVRIVVIDGGRGIDAATLGRIFEPFFTTREEGNGLGLATVREIVEDHGGALNVWSRPGSGSRFEVWLPCRQAASVLDPATEEIPTGRGETLLVVDDDNERLLRDEEILAALGYEPVGFTAVADALAACKSRPERFDAAVVVLGGREADVLEFATVLRALAPDLPVVFATCSADHVVADSLVAAGVSEIVHRPLNSVEIASVLMRCLALVRNTLLQHESATGASTAAGGNSTIARTHKDRDAACA
jgi:signal transduction histidine kinase/ActR/RegA family two-component response regulator